jgi:hypothetical protein
MVTVDAPTYEFHQPKLWGSLVVRCTLDDGALIVVVDGNPSPRFSYQDITAVHLSSRAHGRNEAVMQVRDFRCRVTARGQVVEITNCSDRGVGHRFQYQNQAFSSFVRELHQRLLPFQKSVQFRSGHAWYFRLAAAAGALTAVIAPFRLASYEDHLAFGIATYLSAVIGLWVTAARLRPRNYPPKDIPATLLPAGEDRGGVVA